MTSQRTPIKPSHWARVAELFDACLAVPPEARASLIALRCGGDENLEREVKSLLAALESAGGRFERPAISSLSTEASEPAGSSALQAGDRIGVYEIQREVGHGGMGAIYEAVRADDQYRKRVAVKTIWRGGDSALIVRRFRQERQILAGLDHPNICALLDGGMTDDGRPYFVMEYVEGRPIDSFCAEMRLGIRERVALCRQVCTAVQYAHRKLVVHRDLKPSNILVTADGVVKLLDFGIAKLIPEGDASDSTLTRAGLHLRTTTYASPEQVRGETIATASDVYSLGVVLYELLAGRPPFVVPGRTPHELERRICEETPMRPSAAATESTALSTGLGSVSRLRRALQGELDDIVMMALRKEPERRYSSVEQFSEDLRRYLDQLPVSARRDSLGYRTRKFVRRNRTGVVIGAAAMAAIALAMVAVAAQGRTAARERDRARVAAAVADRERANAENVVRFLQNVIGAADPSWYSSAERPSTRTTITTLFDAAAERVEGELASQPHTLADVLRMLGAANRALGRHELAREQLERALELHRSTRGPVSPAVARDEHELGLLLVERGDFAAAEMWMRQSLGTFRRASDSTSDAYGRLLNDLGVLLISVGRMVEAEPLLRASATHRRALDSLSVGNAIIAGNVAHVLSSRGKLDEAEAAYREALAGFARFPEREYFEKGYVLSNFAIDLMVRGRTREALSLANESVTLWKRLLGPRHPTVGIGLVTVARVLHTSGDEFAALRAALEAESVFRQSLPEGHPDFARTHAIIGQILLSLGRVDEAEPRLRRALAIRLAASPNAVAAGEWESALGSLLRERGRYASAESLLTSGYGRLRRGLGLSDPRVLGALRELIALYERQGNETRVRAYRDSLARATTSR